MAVIGTTFTALMWTALAGRGMETCHYLYEKKQKEDMVMARRSAKANPYINGNAATVSQKDKKKKPQNVYQNPKKKKKK